VEDSGNRASNGVLVSVVIPCHDHAKYLPEAIESALKQTVDCEVVVVDDGSSDGSAEVASRYPVVLIRQSNRGLPTARNVGIRRATGTHILPLDADDRLHRMCVERMLERSTTSIVRGTVRMFGQRNCIVHPTSAPTLAEFSKRNRSGCTCLFPKEAWKSVGGYDAKMRDGYEDWDFWVRLLHSGYRMENAPAAVWFYRKHGPSMLTQALGRHEATLGYMHDKWRRLGIIE
jgi:glycosyltransferase involved in cell wall biosynthesis